MNSIPTLIAEYPGDANWKEFVRGVDAPDDRIESVACAVIGANAGAWLRSEIPALDGRSPLNVIRWRLGGRKAVRTLLMRLP